MLSELQQKVLATLAKNRDYGACFMGGNKRAHVLSACRALVRKGFAWNMGGSRFAISDAGVKAAHGIK